MRAVHAGGRGRGPGAGASRRYVRPGVTNTSLIRVDLGAGGRPETVLTSTTIYLCVRTSRLLTRAGVLIISAITATHTAARARSVLRVPVIAQIMSTAECLDDELLRYLVRERCMFLGMVLLVMHLHL